MACNPCWSWAIRAGRGTRWERDVKDPLRASRTAAYWIEAPAQSILRRLVANAKIEAREVFAQRLMFVLWPSLEIPSWSLNARNVRRVAIRRWKTVDHVWRAIKSVQEKASSEEWFVARRRGATDDARRVEDYNRWRGGRKKEP